MGDCYLTLCGLSHHPPFQFLHPKRTFRMFTFFVAQPLRFFLLRIFLWPIPADWFYWLVLLLLGALSTLSFFWSTCQWCLGKPSGFGRKTKYPPFNQYATIKAKQTWSQVSGDWDICSQKTFCEWRELLFLILNGFNCAPTPQKATKNNLRLCFVFGE